MQAQRAGIDPSTVEAPEQFLRRKEVERLTGIPTSTLYEMMARGEFPPSYRITPRLVAWKRSQIVGWMASRPAYQPTRAVA